MRFSTFQSAIYTLNEVAYADIGARSKDWAIGANQLGKRFDLSKLTKDTFPNPGPYVITDGKVYPEPKSGGEFHILALDQSRRAGRIVFGVVDGVIQVVMSCDIVQKSWHVRHLVAKNNSKMKAHDLYAAIVRTGKILVGQHQSLGGRAVWKKLSGSPGVVVYGWDPKTKTPINLGSKYDSDEIHTDAPVERGERTTYDMDKKYLDRIWIVAAPKNINIKVSI